MDDNDNDISFINTGAYPVFLWMHSNLVDGVIRGHKNVKYCYLFLTGCMYVCFPSMLGTHLKYLYYDCVFNPKLKKNLIYEKHCNMLKMGLNRKGARTVHKKVGNSRQNITIIATVNAEGQALPPHVILPGKTARAAQGYDLEAAGPGTSYSVSDKGWTKQVQIGTDQFMYFFMCM